MKDKIWIASDHAGFELKEYFKKKMSEIQWIDMGTHHNDRVDYPDFAIRLCQTLLIQAPYGSPLQALSGSFHDSPMGVLICGSGQGMAITANRFKGIRAALCWSEETALMARKHNDANILCLSARFVSQEINTGIFNVFTKTSFEGGRYKKRIEKIESKK